MPGYTYQKYTAGFRSAGCEPNGLVPTGQCHAKNSIRRVFLLTWLLTSIGLSAWAANPQVKAVVDRNRINISESIRLQVIITGTEGRVDVSGITDFEIVSRGTRTSIQIVNGKTTKSLISNYTLLPRRKGRLQIPPLPVRAGDRTRMTRAITVQVSDQPQSASGRTEVIVKANVSDKNPFQGQQLLYTLTVYHSESLTNVRLEKPSFEGFTVNSIEEQKTGSTVINGRPYRSIQLAYLLIPIDAGRKVIEPSVLRCDIVRPPRGSPRSAFDSFFDNDPLFGRSRREPRVLRTKELSVTVRSLPPFTGSGDFSGLVGSFQIRSELDLAELKTGESTTLTLTITGKGNIVDAVLPQMDLPDVFKIYRDNPEEDIRLGPDGFSGKKIFRIALVPVQPGRFTIEGINSSYFDVNAERYRDLRTTPLALNVLPSDQEDAMVVFQSPSATMPSLKKKVEFTGRDILPIKEDLDALQNQRHMSELWFAGLMLIPALLFAAVSMAFHLTRKRTDPVSLMNERSRLALKQAANSISNQPEFLAHLYRAISAAIFARAERTGESLTYTEAGNLLKQTGLGAEITEKVVHMLRLIDSARYGGEAPPTDTARALLQQSRKLIRLMAK